MLYLHRQLQKQGLSNYQIQKLVKEGKLYFIQKGVYSPTPKVNDLELIAKKHPNAIFTLTTACYCYGLIKKKYTPYMIATKQKDRPIKDAMVKQIFMKDELYPIGISQVRFQNVDILAYDLERLLIEVVRNKTTLDFDVYSEIINSFKKIKSLLNKKKLEQYLPNFKDPRIIKRINKELWNG